MYYHLLPDDEREAATLFTSDSLDRVQALEAGYLVPFLNNGRFGFMNPAGEEIIRPEAEAINEDYVCGDITEDVLVVPGRLLSRNGSGDLSWKRRSPGRSGARLCSVETDSCVSVIHKTGFTVGDSCLEDARLLANHFAGAKERRSLVGLDIYGQNATAL